MNDITLTFADGRTLHVDYGVRVADYLAVGGDPNDSPIVAALVNNELVSLSYKIKINAAVRPVCLDSPHGLDMYRRSLCFLLAMVAHRVYPTRSLVIGHSLGEGYFYRFKDSDPLGDLTDLDREMRACVGRAEPFRRSAIAYHEAVSYFLTRNQVATAELLESRNEGKVPIYVCGEFLDLAHAPLLPHAGFLTNFELRPYGPGLVLRFPETPSKPLLSEFRDSPLLFSIYQEYKDWGAVLKVGSVGRLNGISSTREIKQFILVAEALHNKKIARIADRVWEQRDDVRVVLVAGPSSSGKTTFTKRLAVELTAMGFSPAVVSLDDYFVSRDLTPRDEFGNFDFEAIEAIDIGLLNEHLLRLFRGEEVEIPAFDFKTGNRRPQGRRLKLQENGILLIEGIHGLNDRLTPLVQPKQKVKVYVSALTQLNLDENNRISTTDNRLIRRLVRDYQFRGHSALTTLSMWPSVRRGENRNIFPFQDSADTAFNSALDYELGVLKPYAEVILRTVKPNHDVYSEARRLLSFLDNFLPIPARQVPDYSILREFIGDSGFKY